MILKSRHFLLFILFFFFVYSVQAQGEKNSIGLNKILDSIAQQHNVKFSYVEEDIKGLYIYSPAANMPLRAKLVYIYNRTGLNHKEIGEYIVLYRNNSAQSKKICAYVTDEYGYPLESTSVQYGNKKILVTGKDGYFELPGELTDNLYVEHLGFQPAVVSVKKYDGDCLEIVLSIKTLELKEIITERYLATGIAKSKDGSFSIKPKKFGILPGLIEPDVLLAMQQLPGINSIDETVSNINVRGGTHDQNLFTWNGIRLFQTGHFFGLISALNPNIAYDIQIAKNGSSAFFGESVSSTVAISSHSKDIESSTTTIGSNMINADFYTKFKTSDNASLAFSARRSFTDVLDFPTYSKYSKRIFQNTVVTELNNSIDVNYKSDKEFYFYDFTAQYHQKIGQKHNIYLDLIGIKNKLDFIQGTITETNVVTKSSSLDQLTLGGALNWDTHWSDTYSTQISIYGSYYNVDGRNESIEFNQVTEQENIIMDTGLRLSNSNIINNKFQLHSGYQYNETGIRNTDWVNIPSFSRNIKKVLRTHALVGELDYISENKKMYTKAGLRGNYIEQFAKVYIEPRVQFHYTINNLWQLEMLAEQKSQSTSQVVELQGDFLGIEKRRWIMTNNDDIPLQRSNQLSVGATFKNKGWMVSADNFYKKVNGITASGQAFQDQLEQLQASGSYTVFGTEFLIQKQFKDFHAWLSYTWNNNSYTFEEVLPQTFTNSFEISHTVNTAVIYEWYNIKIALGSKWYTGRPYTIPLINIPTYDNNGIPAIAYENSNTDNIGNLFQVNFSASYRLQLSQKLNMQLGVSVLNIFNRQNIINRYYRINANEDIEVVNTYSIERTPNALIRLSF